MLEGYLPHLLQKQIKNSKAFIWATKFCLVYSVDPGDTSIHFQFQLPALIQVTKWSDGCTFL